MQIKVSENVVSRVFCVSSELKNFVSSQYQKKGLRAARAISNPDNDFPKTRFFKPNFLLVCKKVIKTLSASMVFWIAGVTNQGDFVGILLID